LAQDQQAAWAAARTKSSSLRAQFLRLKSRRGPKKAILALAASILTAVNPMLRDGVPYQDLGPQHFHQRDPLKRVNRLLRRVTDLGFHMEIRPAA
jgi:hypothetical protein